MLGKNFPIADYYRENILDALTVSRQGAWWTAVLLIEDPKTKKPFISLYKWQSTESGWRIRSRFHFKRAAEMKSIMDAIQQFSEKMD